MKYLDISYDFLLFVSMQDFVRCSILNHPFFCPNLPRRQDIYSPLNLSLLFWKRRQLYPGYENCNHIGDQSFPVWLFSCVPPKWGNTDCVYDLMNSFSHTLSSSFMNISLSYPHPCHIHP
jgi:hypothetical protein